MLLIDCMHYFTCVSGQGREIVQVMKKQEYRYLYIEIIEQHKKIYYKNEREISLTTLMLYIVYRSKLCLGLFCGVLKYDTLHEVALLVIYLIINAQVPSRVGYLCPTHPAGHLCVILHCN